jgi:hypothetical protein
MLYLLEQVTLSGVEAGMPFALACLGPMYLEPVLVPSWTEALGSNPQWEDGANSPAAT